MAHDANFCGDRLRLAAFLRIMEYGIPPRPTRFRRRVQAVEKPMRGSDPSPTNQEYSFVNTSAAIPIHGVSRPSTPEATTSGVDASRTHHSSPSNPLATDADSTYDIPPSHTSIEPYVGLIKDGIHEPTGLQQQHANGLLVKQSLQNAGIMSSSNSHKTPSKPRPSSSTRKRRLPVNCLALMRTSTSDGLPEPSNIDSHLSIPITKIDPIEDSHNFSGRTAVPMERHRAMASSSQIKASTSRAPWTPRASSIYPAKSSNSPTRGYKRPTTHSNLELQIQSAFAVASDGFVGEELTITRTQKRTKRSGKNILQETQLGFASGGLVLGNGRLPSPRHECISPSLPDSGLRSSSGLHTPFQVGSSQRSAIPIQLILTRNHNVTDSRPVESGCFRKRETAVHTQLSSITAPLRRDSESSRSEAMDEDDHINDNGDPNIDGSVSGESQNSDGFINDEECDGTDSTSPSRFKHLSRKPTYVDDSSYYQQAMHDLDMNMTHLVDRVRSRYPDFAEGTVSREYTAA
ncbi:hypothetical protein P153DRAFT_396853 [Dothidotthia symphoricarpi CBS 119687]|uniref:Uncharacterized protein n=1 Tax=Dothidotthia symphoricarpi CBS 119687 TaxID=1392245 RepID=A0A6A6ADG6_9PLEO|nr:uncharacterized protein P153DRAFT_396853 [Dothidotthia symphoricarpi CBS 119687]KAF2129596.1 hypothetical protein P153DRAFT_396853 [Dothidotthia symphoricarpi CBS 119687]